MIDRKTEIQLNEERIMQISGLMLEIKHPSEWPERLADLVESLTELDGLSLLRVGKITDEVVKASPYKAVREISIYDLTVTLAKLEPEDRNPALLEYAAQIRKIKALLPPPE